jgi:hypothetical protein
LTNSQPNSPKATGRRPIKLEMIKEGNITPKTNEIQMEYFKNLYSLFQKHFIT